MRKLVTRIDVVDIDDVVSTIADAEALIDVERGYSGGFSSGSDATAFPDLNVSSDRGLSHW